MPARTNDMNHPIRHNGPDDHLGRCDDDLFFLQDFFKNPADAVAIIFKFFNNLDLLSIYA